MIKVSSFSPFLIIKVVHLCVLGKVIESALISRTQRLEKALMDVEPRVSLKVAID